MNYIEGKACIEFEDHRWCCDGAHANEEYVVGYLKMPEAREYVGALGVVTSWKGDVEIGKAVITARWPIRSWTSEHMHQVQITTPDGLIFTGRTMGHGMLYRGRKIKRQ